LGVVLILSAVTAVVRSVLVRRTMFVAVTAVGLVAIVVAAWSGASFVANGSSAASMGMAIATGLAIGAYVLVLFASGGHQSTSPPQPSP
jgi:hypothetical protein